MEVRWSPEAADDFEEIVRYIQGDSPSGAKDVASRIFESIESLETFPNRGRPGKMIGTRELVLAPLPWIIVYRLSRSVVEIVRIYHGAQRWP